MMDILSGVKPLIVDVRQNRSSPPAIHVPTLVVHLSDDRLINIGCGRHLGEHIVGATFVEVPGATEKAEPKKKEIVLGISDGMNVEVASGLEKGSKVLERPPKKIS